MRRGIEPIVTGKVMRENGKDILEVTTSDPFLRGIIRCASYLLGLTPLTKEIYGEKTIPRGRDKTAGTRAPP
jgi:hypothetical protein